MATPTYEAIATITLTSSASSVTFSSIPQDYRDLIVVARFFYDTSNTYTLYELNNQAQSGSLYTNVFMDTFSGPTSGNSIGNIFEYHKTVTSSTPIQAQMNLLDYSATDKHKTSLIRFGEASGSMVGAYATRWANTAAVTSLVLKTNSGNFQAGSTIAIYGIEA